MMLQNELAFGQLGYVVAEASGCDVIVRVRDDFTTEVEQSLEGNRKKFFWFDREGRLTAEKKTTADKPEKEMQMAYEGSDPNSKVTVTYTTGISSNDNLVEVKSVQELLTLSKAVAAFIARAAVIMDPLTSPEIKASCQIFGQEMFLGKGRG